MSDETKRYTAEEMRDRAVAIDFLKGHVADESRMLRQAAKTEALISELKAIAKSWERSEVKCTESEYVWGRLDGMDLCADMLKETLARLGV